MRAAVIYSTVALIGVLTMGFELLGSRILAPYFGSGIQTWAWLISTFLAAFSVGSIVGGLISRSNDRFRILIVVSVLGTIALLITASAGRPLLRSLEAAQWSTSAAICCACLGLFFMPVVALAAFTPTCVQILANRGSDPGVASGLVYGISTFGNIGGVMLTAFVLLPTLPVSALLYLWTAVGAVAMAIMAMLSRSS